jgi:hypothetical protein
MTSHLAAVVGTAVIRTALDPPRRIPPLIAAYIRVAYTHYPPVGCNEFGLAAPNVVSRRNIAQDLGMALRNL